MNSYCFKQTMRWYGPSDPVTLRDIRQAGATGVVTSLHQFAPGVEWPDEAIAERMQIIRDAGLEWEVVESVNVHEDIKRRSGSFQSCIDSYKVTLERLAAHGIKTVIYNFMPVVDWVRTDLYYTTEDGSKAMYFEKAAYDAFDMFILKRPGAEQERTADEIAKARVRLETMTSAETDVLLSVLLSGLPGSDEKYTIPNILKELEAYDGIDDKTLRKNLYLFLEEICPVAESVGIRMAMHPDDPPYSVFGLPRIGSTEADYQAMIDAVPSPANGICFCTGSLSARPDNDLPGMAARLGHRIYAAHLRSTQRVGDGNFFEANHLEGSVDMFQVVKNLLVWLQKRGENLHIRPDHGHQMMDDLNKEQKYFGYSCIGRMRGLAELRGLELGILRSMAE